MLMELVEQCLRVDGIELCVCVDGSTDGTRETLEILQRRSKGRLQFVVTSNQGRAAALLKAIALASAEFVMIFDDDDSIDAAGLQEALIHAEAAGPSLCGVICHLRDENGKRLGGDFREETSNFLKLRADEAVWGDKKEIVRRRMLLKSLYARRHNERRVPTSTIWAKLALSYDVACLNIDIGTKRYEAGGYTSRIASLKRKNPGPMMRLHCLRLSGFFRGRYRSPVYAARSLAGAIWYAFNLMMVRNSVDA